MFLVMGVGIKKTLKRTVTFNLQNQVDPISKTVHVDVLNFVVNTS